MKKIKLPSGVELKIDLAPFADARELYQSVLKECQLSLKISDNDEIDVNLFKDAFCSLLASKDIEMKIWKCFERVVYGKEKISEETFESEVARGDYILVCYEVSLANIIPFTKGLYAELSPVLELLGKLKDFQP